MGDLVVVHINVLSGTTAEVELEQQQTAQAALLAIDNANGEIKALVGGYDFEQSKFDRATQAMRQTGSSFKVYVYSEALSQGMSPFDTVVDEPVTYHSGGLDYSPHNYDDKFEGRITLRRALADSRNVPAVRLLDRVGIENTIDLARKFGLTSPLPPYLPLALGAADLTLIEHTSAFTVFPDDGIHIEPHFIRRVTSYDGTCSKRTGPNVTDVLSPDVAHTMTAMLEDVVQFGTGVRAKELGRPSGRQDGHHQRLHRRVVHRLHAADHRRRLGGQRRHARLARHEGNGRARRALPIWLEFMQKAMQGMPVEDFPNVVPLEKQVGEHVVQVDTPDTAPPADAAEQGLTQTKAPAHRPRRQLPRHRRLPRRRLPAPTPAPATTPAQADASPARTDETTQG